MKRYHLRVLYISSADRYFEAYVNAAELVIEDGIYKFLDSDDNLLCAYPTRYTIITTIDDIEDVSGTLKL